MYPPLSLRLTWRKPEQCDITVGRYSEGLSKFSRLSVRAGSNIGVLAIWSLSFLMYIVVVVSPNGDVCTRFHRLRPSLSVNSTAA